MKSTSADYMLGSLILLATSGIGVWWLLIGNKTGFDNNPKLSPEPTKTEIKEEKMDSVYKSIEGGFEVVYSPDRKLEESTEGSGNRYTFFRKDSIITVHVGSEWSWTHPKRVFGQDLMVAGKDTFVYKTEEQMMIDLENKAKKYTIQCVHNGIEAVKTECQKFLEKFSLTS